MMNIVFIKPPIFFYPVLKIRIFSLKPPFTLKCSPIKKATFCTTIRLLFTKAIFVSWISIPFHIEFETKRIFVIMVQETKSEYISFWWIEFEHWTHYQLLTITTNERTFQLAGIRNTIYVNLWFTSPPPSFGLKDRSTHQNVRPWLELSDNLSPSSTIMPHIQHKQTLESYVVD